MSTTVSAFRFPLYRRLWSANAVSNVGTWMQTIAAGWLVYELTGSAAWVGLLGLAQRAPILVLSPLAGSLADRHDRRLVILACTAAQAAAATVLAVFVWADLGGALGVVLLVGLTGVGAALTGPALFALTPALVPPEAVGSAMRLQSVGFNVARVFGPGLAGALLATVGPEACFAVNAASFFAVMVSVMLLPPSPPAEGAGKGGLRAAFRYARSHPTVGRLLVGMAVFTAFAAPLQLLMPALSGAVSGGPGNLGLMVTSFGAGALLGAWLLGGPLAEMPRQRVISLAALGFAVALAGAALSPDRIPLAAATAVAGAFWMWTFASVGTELQLVVDDALRGRVMALYLLAIVGPMPFASGLVGLLADQIGIRAALVACAVPLAAWGLFALRRPEPEPHPGWAG